MLLFFGNIRKVMPYQVRVEILIWYLQATMPFTLLAGDSMVPLGAMSLPTAVDQRSFLQGLSPIMFFIQHLAQWGPDIRLQLISQCLW